MFKNSNDAFWFYFYIFSPLLFLFCDRNFSILPEDPILSDISNQMKLKLGNLIPGIHFWDFTLQLKTEN